MMYKTQLICCIIVFFIGVFYFVSVKNRKTKSHIWYSTLLITSVLQLIFDVLSVVTVNNPDTIPLWINNLVHQCFMALMLVIFLAVYKYLETVIEAEIGKQFHSAKWVYIPLAISFLGVIILPIHYMETPQGNYSYGPGPVNIYVSIAIYVILIFRLLLKYGKMIYPKKTRAIAIAMLSEAIIASYQAIVPTALISCLGITLLNLSFFIMVENPDAALVELLKKETKRADVANRAKTDFLANMSHEIRTPINSMVGMTEMILREDDKDKIKEYATDVQNATKSLLNIINDILDISKIEAGKMTIVSAEYSFSGLMKEIISMMEFRMKDRDLGFDVQIDSSIPDKLLGDDIHIRQVLVNLLNNAFKYTAEGTVSLKVELLPTSTEKHAHIKFVVKDTGQGIKKEDMEKIMIPYERFDITKNRNIEGSGLGLPITFKLLAGMGSRMYVESQYGQGSEFSFELCQEIIDNTPISDIEQEQESRQIKKYVPAFEAPNACVLVVDDNKMNRKVFKALLSKTRIEVDEASSGKECIELVQKKAYDIIFMDHMMPEMDGVETYSILKKMEDYPSKKTPVVVVTANAIIGAKDRYIVKDGFRAYLSKPLEYDKLEKVIKMLLKKSKIQTVEQEPEESKAEDAELPIINGVDWGYAENHFNSRSDMLQTMAFFRASIDEDMEELKGLYQDLENADGYKKYCTKIHSMKNSAATVGIIPLAGMAKVMEDAAREEKKETIQSLMPVFEEKWMSYKVLLGGVITDGEEEKEEADERQWLAIKDNILKAAKEMDIDRLDELSAQMGQLVFPDSCKEEIQNIQAAIVRFDVEYLLDI